jgi:hypothetical protein
MLSCAPNLKGLTPQLYIFLVPQLLFLQSECKEQVHEMFFEQIIKEACSPSFT